MDVIVSKQEGETRITLAGEVNLSNVTTCRERIVHEIAGADSETAITLDMSDVSYIDSSAIGMLLFLQKQCQERGHVFSLTKLQPDVMKVLEFGNFDKVFSFS